MKPAEDIAAVANSDARGRARTAPRVRRLATSSAEANIAVSFDATEQLS